MQSFRILTYTLLLTTIYSIFNPVFVQGNPSIFSDDDQIVTSEGEISNDELDEVNSKTILPEAKADDLSNLKVCSQAKIIVINKITAQSKEMDLKLGESKYFGNIEVKVYKCYKELNPYAPDNKILLSATEEKVDDEPTLLFQGWMMSSNISISTFEHPVYEIFAKDCF